MRADVFEVLAGFLQLLNQAQNTVGTDRGDQQRHDGGHDHSDLDQLVLPEQIENRRGGRDRDHRDDQCSGDGTPDDLSIHRDLKQRKR